MSARSLVERLRDAAEPDTAPGHADLCESHRALVREAADELDVCNWTRRDVIALAVLPKLVHCPDVIVTDGVSTTVWLVRDPASAVEDAYLYADAMLKARGGSK